MLIDWFTVVAQLINFVILLVALKYFLFDRIVEAMERRRIQLAEAEAEIHRGRADVEAESDRLESDRRRLEADQQRLIDEAREVADERRRHMLEEARERVAERERQWLTTLRSEQDRLVSDLERTACEQAMGIARRALDELAGENLESAVVRRFVDRLDQMDTAERTEVEAALAGSGRLGVSSAFDLTAEDRASVAAAIARVLETGEVDLVWSRNADLLAGIVLRTDGRTIGWSFDGYLRSLEDSVGDSIDRAVRHSSDLRGVDHHDGTEWPPPAAGEVAHAEHL